MHFCRSLILMATLLVTSSGVFAQNLVEDGEFAMSVEEFSEAVNQWTPNMREAAANDPIARYELVGLTLAAKKIAAEAAGLTKEDNPKQYWDIHFRVQEVKRRAVIDAFLSSLEVPDMEPVARERFDADPDKYALVPERRISSHILFLCQPSDCDREVVLARQEEVIAKLAAGERFEDLAQQYSDDPGSKNIGGKFDRWLTAASEGVVRVRLRVVSARECRGR